MMAAAGQAIPHQLREQQREGWAETVQLATQELQTELVASWLGARDAETRERCWHEVRALEAISQRLVRNIAGEAEDPDPVVVDGLAELEEPFWQAPFPRFIAAIQRWRAGGAR